MRIIIVYISAGYLRIPASGVFAHDCSAGFLSRGTKSLGGVQIGGVDRFIDEGIVSIVKTEVDELDLLDRRIIPSVVDAKGDKVDSFTM